MSDREKARRKKMKIFLFSAKLLTSREKQKFPLSIFKTFFSPLSLSRFLHISDTGMDGSEEKGESGMSGNSSS